MTLVLERPYIKEVWVVNRCSQIACRLIAKVVSIPDNHSASVLLLKRGKRSESSLGWGITAIVWRFLKIPWKCPALPDLKHNLLLNLSPLLIVVKLCQSVLPHPFLHLNLAKSQWLYSEADFRLLTPLILFPENCLQGLQCLLSRNVLHISELLIAFVLQTLGKEGNIRIYPQIGSDTINDTGRLLEDKGLSYKN